MAYCHSLGAVHETVRLVEEVALDYEICPQRDWVDKCLAAADSGEQSPHFERKSHSGGVASDSALPSSCLLSGSNLALEEVEEAAEASLVEEVEEKGHDHGSGRGGTTFRHKLKFGSLARNRIVGVYIHYALDTALSDRCSICCAVLGVVENFVTCAKSDEHANFRRSRICC